MTHWYMSDISQQKVSGGFDIRVTTDVACHLWLRYTGVIPVQHRKPTLRRGLFVSWDYRQCFVAYKDIEQIQDGDTLFHNFTWLSWYHCLWRWFYFWGLISDVVSKSTSPIFSKHYSEPVYPTEYIEYWTWLGLPVPTWVNSYLEYWSS